VLEFTDQAGDAWANPLVIITPGVVYHGFNRLNSRWGIPFGLNGTSPDVGVVVKATFRLAALSKVVRWFG